MNTTIAVSRIRLPPNRSPSQPDAGMNTARLTRKAIEMLSTAVGLTPNSRPIVGSATLTIVTSMIDMNMAATKTTLTATFWLIRPCTTFLFVDRSASAAIPASPARRSARASRRIRGPR